ncbi:MAG: hypothetical protein ACXVFK_01305 [Solirubrobacteraceae bacterium]
MRAIAACAAATLLIGCGGAANADASVRSTVVRYFAALRHSRAADACEMLTEPSQEKLGEFGYDVLKTGHRSCPAAFKALFGSVAGPRLRALGAPKITRVTRDDDRATAHVDGIGAPIKLVHGKDGWRIESEPSVEPDKLPGAAKRPDAG